MASVTTVLGDLGYLTVQVHTGSFNWRKDPVHQTDSSTIKTESMDGFLKMEQTLRHILCILDVVWEAQKSFHNLVERERADSAILTSIFHAIYQVFSTGVKVRLFEYREFKT